MISVAMRAICVFWAWRFCPPLQFFQESPATSTTLKFAAPTFSMHFMEKELLTEQTYRDWTATVRLEKYALRGSGK